MNPQNGINVLADNNHQVAGMAFNQAPPPNYVPTPIQVNPGDSRLANRNWAAREQQINYEMAQAPLPHQYTQEQPHPMLEAPRGNAVTQYQRPQMAPTGFQARGLNQAYIDAGGRAPVVYSNPRAPQVARPTTAYNRVVGRGQPTMYVTTWPAYQGYPQGSNTFIPSWEATGLLIKSTRDASNFRINKYLKELKVPKSQGYYLTLGIDDPYRVVNVNDFLWADSADAPGGRDQRQSFGFVNYQTGRYCFPFSLGQKSVDQAEWPIVAEHGAMQAAKAMTVRTLILQTLATTTGNWSGSYGTNTAAAAHAWTTQGVNTANPPPYLQNDLNTALIQIESSSGGIITDEEALQFTMNPTESRGVSTSDEYRQYIKGSPDALSALTDQRNPNRRYGLAPYIYGLSLVVENAIQVTTPKSGNVPSPPSQSRAYIWPTANAMITSKPRGIVGEDQQTLDFSTFAIRMYESMTVETKSDPDNRRTVGRVVEDYTISLQAPFTGFLFSGCS